MDSGCNHRATEPGDVFLEPIRYIPRRIPPPDLCYAVVVKEREKGRVVEVTTRIVYGTTPD